MTLGQRPSRNTTTHVKFLQLLALPGEILTEICRYLDPRSHVYFTMAHQHFAKFMDDKLLWSHVYLTSNWVYHNDTFVFLQQFSAKVLSIMFRHTGRMPRYIVSYAEGSLSFMPNLKRVYVSSPYFEFCHFLRRTPQIESLEFAHCPHFDVDSFVTSIKQCPLVQLCTLDLRGASSVSSMDLWEVTKHLPKLSKLFVDTPVSDIFAKEIFENLPNLTHFDCVAPNWCLEEWRSLVDKFHWVQLGPQLQAHL